MFYGTGPRAVRIAACLIFSLCSHRPNDAMSPTLPTKELQDQEIPKRLVKCTKTGKKKKQNDQASAA
jgi:hypothetical protein